MNKAAGARGKIFSTHAVPHVYADAFGKPIDAERFWQALLQQKNGWGNEGNYSILSNWQFRPALLSIFNFSLLSTYRSDSGFIRLGVPSYPKSSDLVIWRFCFVFFITAASWASCTSVFTLKIKPGPCFSIHPYWPPFSISPSTLSKAVFPLSTSEVS